MPPKVWPAGRRDYRRVLVIIHQMRSEAVILAVVPAPFAQEIPLTGAAAFAAVAYTQVKRGVAGLKAVLVFRGLGGNCLLWEIDGIIVHDGKGIAKNPEADHEEHEPGERGFCRSCHGYIITPYPATMAG